MNSGGAGPSRTAEAATLFAQGFIAPVQFSMNGQQVSFTETEVAEYQVWIGDHQMDVHRDGGLCLDRLDRIGAECKVRHEMAVHHVDVEPVYVVGFQYFDVPAQVHQVRAHH